MGELSKRIREAKVLAGEEVVVASLREKGILPPEPKEIHLTDVPLLCAECQQPIKGRINTSQWIRVEYIGPEGECQACVQRKKEKASA